MTKTTETLREFFGRYPSWMLAVGLVIVVGLGIVFVGSSGGYPIATVNGRVVSARSFDANYQAAIFYNRILVGSLSTSSASFVQADPRAIGATVLDQLVAAALIEAGANKEVGSDLDGLVTEKLAAYEQDAELADNIRRFYDMDYATFRSEALVPQARADILAGRLFAKGQRIGDWLVEARRSAKVIILSGSFRWDGEKVVAQ